MAGIAEALEGVLSRPGALLDSDAACFPVDPKADAGALERHLLEELQRLRAGSETDPAANPVLRLALHVGQMLDRDQLADAGVEELVQRLTLRGFAGRGERLRRYLGGLQPGADAERVAALVRGVAESGDFEAFRERFETPTFGVVFTAHPTFAVTLDLARTLAALAAKGGEEALQRAGARPHAAPRPLTLSVEHEWSLEALGHAHDALDRLNRIILEVARDRFPDRWTELAPNFVTLASWVGYDHDGRDDITWRDTLEKRLLVKEAQLRRHEATLARLGRPELAAIAETIEAAHRATERQLAAIAEAASGAGAAAFARRMVGERAALARVDKLLALVAQAIEAAGPELRLDLLVLRASLASHGVSLAHTHVRLNAGQVHNAIRRQVGLTGSPADPAHRRSYVAAINDLLGRASPVAINYGTLRAERATVKRLFMGVAQIAKHIDADTPVRFLIAETESGFTLLTALYFAKLFGVEQMVEISPLFETAQALERGELVIDEALKSPPFRAHVERLGRLAVQFGFSDSGRYLGQMAATFKIERLRLRLAAILAKHGLAHVRVILFNTHGESIGRGAHPSSLADRLRYLCPPRTGAEFRRQGIEVKEEVSFQGGDGFVPFLHADTAFAVLRGIVENRLAPEPEAGADPIYDQTDYAAEFFETIRQFFAALVEDPDYAALLGAFGTQLLYQTGSRPAKRQSEDAAHTPSIEHPSQLRAIPNNAVLQQLGFLANTVSGVGRAAARDPELFAMLLGTSPRFRRAMAMVEHALSLGDPDILRAYIETLDPGLWLARAAAAHRPWRRRKLFDVAEQLGHSEVHARLRRVQRRLFGDWILLRNALESARGGAAGLDQTPRDTLVLLHALRIAVIHRSYLLATRIPSFSPRRGVARGDLVAQIFRLDIPPAVARLKEIFPVVAEDDAAGEDFGERADYRGEAQQTYAQEHAEILDPLLRYHELMRRIGSGITHLAGAVG